MSTALGALIYVKHGDPKRSFPLVLPKAHNLIEHNIILR